MAVRILIADDHEIVREGVRSLIGSIWRGHEREGGRRPGRDSEADVVVLDLTMPVRNGLEATPQITGLGARVLIFTMHESARLSAVLREAGSRGWV